MPFAAGMAIDTKGNVWGWGSNYRSPLCLSGRNMLIPQKLPLTHVTLATGAGWHGLYYSDGKVYAVEETMPVSWGMGPLSRRPAPCWSWVCRSNRSVRSNRHGRTPAP